MDFDDKLNLNFDLTVNSPCFAIGADIIDSSGDNWKYNVQINEESADFELPDENEAKRLKLLKLKNYQVNDGGALSKGMGFISRNI